MEEIWKDIPRYSGYQASNLGRIRTHNKKTFTKKHGERKWEDRILKFKKSIPTSTSKQGIGFRVTLWKDGKPKDFLVARLIATTFLEDLIETKMTINHKNGDRTDNRIENLEWCSQADNVRKGFENNFFPQTNVILKNVISGEIYSFNSLTKASTFLERNKFYIRNCLNKGKKIRSKDKKEYEVLEIKRIESRFK